jgi:hypothetical protein
MRQKSGVYACPGEHTNAPWCQDRARQKSIEFSTSSRYLTIWGASALMKQVVEKLLPEDIIALAAYVGSLEP